MMESGNSCDTVAESRRFVSTGMEEIVPMYRMVNTPV
jgi:hypothetical protein